MTKTMIALMCLTTANALMLTGYSTLARGSGESESEVSARTGRPALVAAAVANVSGIVHELYRFYDDGSVEVIEVHDVGSGCEKLVVCNAGVIDFCVADSNYDGSVDFTDLLTLLSAWGPCDSPASGG